MNRHQALKTVALAGAGLVVVAPTADAATFRIMSDADQYDINVFGRYVRRRYADVIQQGYEFAAPMTMRSHRAVTIASDGEGDIFLHIDVTSLYRPPV